MCLNMLLKNIHIDSLSLLNFVYIAVFNGEIELEIIERDKWHETGYNYQ